MTRFFTGLVGWFGHRVDDRSINIWAKTEYGKDANWAKDFYYKNGRFPNVTDIH